jgi:ABC-type branched-subunit amino acid transport system substrate-binding protein
MQLALAGLYGGSVGAQTSPMKIGSIADLTGTLAPIGGGLDRGIAAAREVWNAKPDKRKFEISSCDSQSTGAGALSCYQRLKGSVEAFSGPYLFLGIASVRGIADKGAIPIMSTAPMAGPVGDTALESQIFQNLPTLDDGVYAGLAFLKKQGRTRVAVIAANDLPGNITVAAAQRYAAANGITLSSVERFDFTAQSLAAQAENMAASKPDAVMTNIVGPALITGLRALKNANINVPYMLNYAAMSSPLLVSAGEAAGDNLYFYATKSMDPGSIKDEAYRKRAEDFDAAFRRLHNQTPDFVAWVAGDAITILAEAGNAAPGKIRETLLSGQRFDGALWPSYHFSPKDHIGLSGEAAFDILRWQPAKRSWTLVQ